MTTDGAGGLMRYLLVHGAVELCVVAGDDLTAAGPLLWRAVGDEGWLERGLAPLEFQLLRALCDRAHAEAASPSGIRGCVPTKQLARDLPFQSKYANQENVRQVVLRLRGVLAEVGASGVLAVAPGRGYYLAGRVTAASVPGDITVKAQPSTLAPWPPDLTDRTRMSWLTAPSNRRMSSR